MSNRRISREFALQYLYSCDINDDFSSKGIYEFTDNFSEFNKLQKDEANFEFAKNITFGVIDNKDKIDSIIKSHTENWTFSRIALIDRNLLRIAIFEILFMEEIPNIVSIDEAVDIAKKYSTPDSGKFINGILDKIREEFIDKKQL